MAIKNLTNDIVIEGAPFKIRAAFFDIDGTIVGKNHEISPRTKSAIKNLRELGVILGFATGRGSFATVKLGEELGITGPSMFFAGSLILKGSETLYQVELSNLAIDALIRLSNEHKYHMELYTKSDFYAERSNSMLDIHQQYSSQPAKISPFKTIIENSNAVDGSPIIKSVIMAERGENEDQLKKLLSEVDDISVTYSYGAAHPDIVFANIVDSKATREAAFNELCKILQCSAAEIATFGDAEADCAFLRMAKFGFATDNAVQAAKDSASYVTTSVDSGGVGLAIERFFL